MIDYACCVFRLVDCAFDLHQLLVLVSRLLRVALLDIDAYLDVHLYRVHVESAKCSSLMSIADKALYSFRRH